jgi:two-component system sensor histidine kinase/response regulator
VLVAEDDAELRAAIVAALVAGCPQTRVLAAASGAQAWEMLRAGGVDVLLADVVMPELDGIELTRRARRDPTLAGLYVVLITGLASPEELVAAMDHGADDCLLKPCRWDELTVRVRAGLRRVGATRSQAERARVLEKLYQQQRDFLSLVSHEIRGPLAAMLSGATALKRYGRQRPESVERLATVIQQEGRRLTRLINNLLDLAKIEAGQLEWEIAPIALDELLARVSESFEALLGERNLTLNVDHRNAPVVVTLDADKITQVLVNLLVNSISHSPDGATVWLRYWSLGGGGVRIEVEDEGAGIPAGAEERIFDRFHQAKPGDARAGSGLGLTISRQIVEYHGGRIWAEPSRERGALFVIELPGTRAEEIDGSVR